MRGGALPLHHGVQRQGRRPAGVTGPRGRRERREPGDPVACHHQAHGPGQRLRRRHPLHLLHGDQQGRRLQRHRAPGGPPRPSRGRPRRGHRHQRPPPPRRRAHRGVGDRDPEGPPRHRPRRRGRRPVAPRGHRPGSAPVAPLGEPGAHPQGPGLPGQPLRAQRHRRHRQPPHRGPVRGPRPLRRSHRLDAGHGDAGPAVRPPGRRPHPGLPGQPCGPALLAHPRRHRQERGRHHPRRSLPVLLHRAQRPAPDPGRRAPGRRLPRARHRLPGGGAGRRAGLDPGHRAGGPRWLGVRG